MVSYKYSRLRNSIYNIKNHIGTQVTGRFLAENQKRNDFLILGPVQSIWNFYLGRSLYPNAVNRAVAPR